MYYYSVAILVLLNLYCYASPIPSVDEQQPALLPIKIKQLEESILNNPTNELKLHEFNYLIKLCELYGRCNGIDEQRLINYDDKIYKRLSSSLFHGIPKFGKRAFSSAFAGIPKFG